MFFGIAIAMLTLIFGDHWLFFAAFFAANVVDYLTGWWKSRQTKTENSVKGREGAVRKVGYWVIIGIAFFIGVCFTQMGMLLGVNLAFLEMIGYFTLASYTINELRSIIENLIVIGVPVHPFLTKGLAIADKLVNDAVSLKSLGREDNSE